MGEVTSAGVKPEDLAVVCVTAMHGEQHGTVEGNGRLLVTVLNSGNLHFDPLLRVD